MPLKQVWQVTHFVAFVQPYCSIGKKIPRKFGASCLFKAFILAAGVQLFIICILSLHFVSIMACGS